MNNSVIFFFINTCVAAQLWEGAALFVKAYSELRRHIEDHRLNRVFVVFFLNLIQDLLQKGVPC